MAAREVTHVEIASIWIDVSIREEHNAAAEVTRHPVEEGVDITDHVREVPDRLVLEGLVTNQPIELPKSHAGGVIASESGVALTDGQVIGIGRRRATGTNSVSIEGEPTLGMLGLVPGVGQAAALLRVAGADVRQKKKLEMILPAYSNERDQRHAVGLAFNQSFDRVKEVQSALLAAIKARRPVLIKTARRVYESMVLVDLSIIADAGNAGSLRFGATAEQVRVVKSSSGLVGVPDPTHVRAKPSADIGNQNTVPASDEVPVPAQQKMSALKQALEDGNLEGAKAIWGRFFP